MRSIDFIIEIADRVGLGYDLIKLSEAAEEDSDFTHICGNCGDALSLPRPKVSDCCFVEPVGYMGADGGVECDSEDLGMCPKCFDSCEYVEVCPDCMEPDCFGCGRVGL